jgi:hypothetical protein
MRQWTPIVESLPEFGKTVIVELTNNEYLGQDWDEVVPAQLHKCDLTGIMWWAAMRKPFCGSGLLEIINLSSTHIWTELPFSSSESLNCIYYQEKQAGN